LGLSHGDPRLPVGYEAFHGLDSQEIGRRLRAARKDASLFRDDLSAAAGFSPSYVTQVESGAILPPLASLVKLAKALGLDYHDLLPPHA